MTGFPERIGLQTQMAQDGVREKLWNRKAITCMMATQMDNYRVASPFIVFEIYCIDRRGF